MQIGERRERMARGMMRTLPWSSACAVFACIVLFATAAVARTPPAMAPAAQQADRILVDKSERRLQLLRDGRILRSYRVLLGDAPIGGKRQRGDEKTPEGDYSISGRNPNSRFHLSLRISYPNLGDRRQAQARGVDPGGDIFLHGGNSALYPFDWTDGCIAVTDTEIEEIWRLVPTGIPIRIDP